MVERYSSVESVFHNVINDLKHYIPAFPLLFRDD